MDRYVLTLLWVTFAMKDGAWQNRVDFFMGWLVFWLVHTDIGTADKVRALHSSVDTFPGSPVPMFPNSKNLDG